MRTTKVTKITKVGENGLLGLCVLCVLCVLGGSTMGAAFMQASVPPLRSLDKGLQSGIDSPRQVTLGSRDELTKLWRENAQKAPVPAIDFAKEMVVGVFMGSQNTAGFSIEIVGYRLATPGGKDVIVEYRETVPGRDVIAAQVIVAPFHLVAIPRQTGTVTFEKVKS